MTFAQKGNTLKMMHGGELAGSLTYKSPGVIQGVEILPKYQNMGLGRKLYGEAARRSPLEMGRPTLHSDGHVSGEAHRLWQSMGNRPAKGQVVQAHPLSKATTRPLEAGGTTPARRWDYDKIEGGTPNYGMYNMSLPRQAAL